MPGDIPVLGSFGSLLRTALSLACQNDPARAFAPGGEPLAVCARCSGLYFGLAAGALVLRPRLRRAAAWAWLGCGLFVMGLDVATEQLLMRPPSATLRLVTGLLVSYPALLLALAVHPGRRSGDAS
ncbi:MAG: hypothetical protein RJA70_307 [Pseudomonadota bacterium]|jgi:uncharacterized membrane protein